MVTNNVFEEHMSAAAYKHWQTMNTRNAMNKKFDKKFFKHTCNETTECLTNYHGYGTYSILYI